MGGVEVNKKEIENKQQHTQRKYNEHFEQAKLTEQEQSTQETNAQVGHKTENRTNTKKPVSVYKHSLPSSRLNQSEDSGLQLTREELKQQELAVRGQGSLYKMRITS